MNPAWILAPFLLALFPNPAPARSQSPLDRRAHEVAALIREDPEWPDDLFDPSFLKQVPKPRLAAIFEQYAGLLGSKIELQLTDAKDEHSAVYDLIGDKNQVAPMTVTIQKRAPFSVVGLWFGVPGPMTKDLAAIAAEIAKLPGSTSFGVWKLGEMEPEALASHEPDRVLAIGSAFKLYVLGALAKDLQDGKRKLEDVVRIEERWRSLPSGQMQSWPIGSPATLATLAAMMISISDNTATDHLLFTLGRERVEAMLAPMGNGHAEESIPFLSTGEMFRLKTAHEGRDAEEYVKLDAAKKREMLEKKFGGVPLDEKSVDLMAFVAPIHVEEIEWFASAEDLCRAMDWLRRSTESGPAAPLRWALSINPGLAVSKEAFPFVGYKGGSETGVLNLTFLLRAADGTWYAASAGWNDPKAALDDAKLMGLMQRALYLLGKKAGEDEKK